MTAAHRPVAARCLLAALVALLAVAAPGRAAATVVVTKDFAALCREADLIFVGTVTAVESRWVDPDHDAIETLVTFGELTWLQGSPRPAVTLRFAGGEMDGLREVIAGMPRFAVGERRVIFAREGTTAVSPIVGFDQGALRVVDGVDGPEVAADAAASSGSAALRVGPKSTDSVPVGLPLDAFLDRVRERLAGDASGAP